LAAWGIARDGRKVLLHLMAGSREDVETVSGPATRRRPERSPASCAPA
jgi:hypothetical protein